MTEAMNYRPNTPDPNETALQALNSHETTESVDFSKVGPEIAIRYLFTRLRETQYARQTGNSLAQTVVSLTSAAPDSDASSHEARMHALQRMPIDEEFWDKKSAEDPVFALLEKYLRERQERSLSEPRLAARHLFNLRASFTDTSTPTDDEWVDVINRLFR